MVLNVFKTETFLDTVLEIVAKMDKVHFIAAWAPLLQFLKYCLKLEEEDRKLVEARTPKLHEDVCVKFHLFRQAFGERIVSIVDSCVCPRWEEDMGRAANRMKDLKQDGVDVETLVQQGVELSEDTRNTIKSIMAPLQKDPNKRFNPAGTYKRPSDQKLGKGAIQQLETNWGLSAVDL